MIMLKKSRFRLVPAALVVGVLLSGCSRDPVKQRMRELQRGPVPQRLAAVQELGVLKDARAVGPLIAALQDPQESIADAAAVALGRIGDPRAIGPLAAALSHPATRWSAAEALVEMGDPALGPLVTALSGADVQVCKALLVHLKQHEVKDHRLVEPLLRQLHSSDWLVRQSAAESLGRIGDPCAVDGLITALRDDNRLVREEAARVLGEMGDARAVDALLDALRNLNTAQAARALGRIGDARALEPLAAVFRGRRGRDARPRGRGAGSDEERPCARRASGGDPELGIADRGWRWPGGGELETLYGAGASLPLDLPEQRRRPGAGAQQTCRVLLEDVKSKDKSRLDHAVFALLSLGWTDMVPELKRVLEEEGDEKMAETYLNCGYDDLKTAAKAWGGRHGYAITPYGGSRKTSWGDWR